MYSKVLAVRRAVWDLGGSALTAWDGMAVDGLRACPLVILCYLLAVVSWDNKARLTQHRTE